jgi:hypothetical protein
MFIKQFALVGAICLAAASLGGCGSTLGTAGVFAGNSDDPMVTLKITKSDYNPKTGANPITFQQYQAVQEVAERMKIEVSWQTSGNFEACASEGLPYGAAGAAGGATQGLFYHGALAGAAAGVTGATELFAGCVNGLVTHAYDGSYAIGDTVEKAMRDLENDGKEFMVVVGRTDGGLPIKQSLFHDLHATGSFVRTGNHRGSPASGLAAHMPDFHGDPVGSPAN